MLPGTSAAVQAVRLAATIGIALLVLATAARMLHIREFTEAFAMVMRRFRGRA
jgi:hypothetical protein